MSSFSKVRSGITGLKKQKEDLEKNYGFLTQELHRMTDDNTAQIRALAGRSEGFTADISGMKEQLKTNDDNVSNLGANLGSEITGIQKRLEDQKKILDIVSQKIQKATDAAAEAARGISDTRKFENDVSKSLQDISSGLTSANEKISSVDSSSRNAIDAVDKKFTSGMEMVKKLSDTQTAVIKEHDSALEKTMLTLQSLKKDILAGNERMANVKTAAAATAKKLELLGVLKSKIKHIEDVKSGLVQGVESIKSIKNDMSALKQKTKDLETRLSDADKFLESRLLEKAKVLDNQMAGKTASMETQMQERLKFLEENLTEKGRTLETKISADIVAMNKLLSRELADIKKMKTKIEKSDTGLKDLKGNTAALKKATDDNKSELVLLWEKVNSYRDIAGRVAEIEQVRDTIVSGLGRVDKLSEDMKVFSEKRKAFEAKSRDDMASLKAVATRADSGVTGVNLVLAGLRKDLASATKMISSIKTDHDTTKKSVRSMDSLAARLSASEKAVNGIAAKTEEIKLLDKKIASLSKDLGTMKIAMDGADSAIDEKIKYNVSAIKKDTAFNSAALAKIDQDIQGITLTINSLKKDMASESTGSRKLQSAVEKLQNKSADLEKLQIRLGDVEQTKQALTDAMEAKLEDRIKFIETSLRQKADNMEATLAERSKATESMLSGDISQIKNELAAKDKSIESIKQKIDTVVRIEQRLSTAEKDKDTITRNLSSLQNLRTDLVKIGEKSKLFEKNIGELRTDIAAGLTELRGKFDTSRNEEGNKFSTAVKAFLNTKADISKKMGILELKLDENEKRFTDFSRIVTRLDLVEKKLDRISEKDTEMRRQVDNIERRGADERVMVVDLAKDDIDKV